MTFPARGTWIEMPMQSLSGSSMQTFPARGTWIEIDSRGCRQPCQRDVPRKGNVDRNYLVHAPWSRSTKTFPARGTWIEIPCPLWRLRRWATFPARGTWIEMLLRHLFLIAQCDVPRKGNVDRNGSSSRSSKCVSETFPARGTWIEIYLPPSPDRAKLRDVPRKGNVDRNVPCDYIIIL